MNIETEIVYVLTNTAMPGLIKIGVTNQIDLDARMRQLYTTGVPVPFECYYACRVDVSKNVESSLHYAFSSHRINPNREFFRLEPEKVKTILMLLKVDDITDEVEKELAENSDSVDKEAAESLKKKRPRMNFEKMGIPPGSKLLYRDGKTEVTVIDDRMVKLDNEECYLTAATMKVMGITTQIQPSPYWTYNGKLLIDIYDETYSVDAVD
jgi:T5orf172 domain